MLELSCIKSLNKVYRKYEFPSLASTWISSSSEEDSARYNVSSATPEQLGFKHDMAVITSDHTKNFGASPVLETQKDSGLDKNLQDIGKSNEITLQAITGLLNCSDKKQQQSATAAIEPELHVVLNNKLNDSKNGLVGRHEERGYQEILNASLSYVLASEGFYYSSKKNRILPVSPDINDNYDLTELKFLSDEEDFYDDIFESSLKADNIVQSEQLPALHFSIDKPHSRSAPISHANTHSTSLFQGFMDYSPEELFNHLSPQELKVFNKKSPQVNCGLDELDVLAQPKGRRREMSVIANRKSSYIYTTSKRPRIATDCSFNRKTSLSLGSYNSFLSELHVNLGMNLPDSKHGGKSLFKSMANTNQSTPSLKLQKPYLDDIQKHFESPVIAVNAAVLQYESDVPRPKHNSRAGRPLSDGFPPIPTSGQSVIKTSIVNDETVKAVKNEFIKSSLDTSFGIDNETNEPMSNVFFKSASSVYPNNVLSSQGREQKQDKKIIDTPTLWANGGLNNITLGAYEHSKEINKPEDMMFSIIPSQTEKILKSSASTGIKFSNPVSQDAENLREVPFKSSLGDENSVNMIKRPRNSRMFTMSVREKPHTPSKPSWYFASHSPPNTTTSEISTELLLDTSLFAAKSAGGMPVSSIYLYVDREAEPPVPKVDTTDLVDEQLEVTASKFFKKNKEEMIEEKHIRSMEKVKPSSIDLKSKHTQQVENKFAGCFEEIDEFVQEFDARTKDIVNNATAVAAAAAAAVISANTTPAFSEDGNNTFSSFKSDNSAGFNVKPAITASSADPSITLEKKFSVIAELKRSFSKDARKLTSQSSKDVGSSQSLQPVPEDSSAKSKSTKRSKSAISYDSAIEELSQEIDTLKSAKSNRISSHSGKRSLEASSKYSLDNADTSSHGTTIRKKTPTSTGSTDKAVVMTKSENGGGKKLRGVLHAVTFKVRSKFGRDKK
jgi:hypothetical protein